MNRRKSGKLSNVEKLAIQQMQQIGADLEGMCKELNRTEKVVSTYLEELALLKKKVHPQKKKTPKKQKKTGVGDVMAKRVGKDGRVSSTIMTQAASEHGDESRRKSVGPTPKFDDCVRKIK